VPNVFDACGHVSSLVSVFAKFSQIYGHAFTKNVFDVIKDVEAMCPSSVAVLYVYFAFVIARFSRFSGIVSNCKFSRIFGDLPEGKERRDREARNEERERNASVIKLFSCLSRRVTNK